VAALRILRVAGVALLALAAGAPIALAAEAEHKPDLLHIDVPVLVATIVVFLVVLFVLSKTAWGPILRGLKAREDAIRASVEGAERANAEAARLRGELEVRMQAAAEEARKIVEEGRKDAESLRAKIEADAAGEAEQRRQRALRDIELARDAALKELHERVAVVATDVAGRILEERLDPAKHKRLVDDAVASYERSRDRGTRGGRS
jgi:F-type H+-transporting ATPase subunit b